MDATKGVCGYIFSDAGHRWTCAGCRPTERALARRPSPGQREKRYGNCSGVDDDLLDSLKLPGVVEHPEWVRRCDLDRADGEYASAVSGDAVGPRVCRMGAHAYCAASWGAGKCSQL